MDKLTNVMDKTESLASVIGIIFEHRHTFLLRINQDASYKRTVQIQAARTTFWMCCWAHDRKSWQSLHPSCKIIIAVILPLWTQHDWVRVQTKPDNRRGAADEARLFTLQKLNSCETIGRWIFNFSDSLASLSPVKLPLLLILFHPVYLSQMACRLILHN